MRLKSTVVLALTVSAAACLRGVAAAADPLEGAQWMSTGLGGEDSVTPVRPAPVFRKAFTLDRDAGPSRLAVCGLGYFDASVDGKPVTDAMLMPGQTQYDVRWRYRVFDLPPLKAGRHIISIEVGDGFYHASTKEVWHFDKASWLGGPKAICRLVERGTGRELVRSDCTWKVRSCMPERRDGKTTFRPTSPRVFNSVRGGEVYDARLEFPWDETDGPDWLSVCLIPSPGGIAEEETFPPCRVTAVHPMTRVEGTDIWKAPVNLAGNVRLKVRGRRGATVRLMCGEVLRGGEVVMKPIEVFCDVGVTNKTFQRDAYILKGEGVETWTPRFTYHGFQYAEAKIEGEAELLSLEALEIHNDMRRVGSFEASDKRLERVARICERSILANMHNIPTDCPQREKNGWVGDANLRAEATMYVFDAGALFDNAVTLICDTQRPSGQFASIFPCAGWGYHYAGSYSSLGVIEMPMTIRRFTGDGSALDLVRPRLPAFVAFMETMLDGRGVPQVGLWDWLHPKSCPRLDWQYVRLAAYATLLSLDPRFAKEHAKAKKALEEHFFKDGLPPYENSAAYAFAIYAGVLSPEKRSEAAAKMAGVLRRRGHKVDSGMIGTPRVLRALCDYGYVDDAYSVMVQPEKPGYVYFTDTLGLTTLPERWDIDEDTERDGSFCHAAFAEYLACIYRTFAGFRHPDDEPGPDFIEIRPVPPTALEWIKAEHLGYRVEWARRGGAVDFTVTVPEGKRARLALPGGEARVVGPGTYRETRP